MRHTCKANMSQFSRLVVLFCFQGSPEKEGFEPSRRFSRPTPFPGEPLRPAWVLLHGRLIINAVPALTPLRLITGRPAGKKALRRNGEDGIRTHVPVKANGFQDRLVMTTSIPLQRAKTHKKISALIVSASNILTNLLWGVNDFFLIFYAKKFLP